MYPDPDPNFDSRVKFDRLILREGEHTATVGSLDQAMGLILAQPTGRVNVRGANGSGKSSLLTSLKVQVKNRAYYWPTADRLSFQFAQKIDLVDPDEEEDAPKPPGEDARRLGFSSGERQLRALREIVQHTDAAIYLLDEWDANLDPNNRAAAEDLVQELARRARVVEISHRDRV
jgi:ABC-type transport system involved in cytochrome bd biosynthesis fused ATPase/permease subunit